MKEWAQENYSWDLFNKAIMNAVFTINQPLACPV